MAEDVERYYDSIAGKYDWFLSGFDATGEEQRRALEPLLKQHGVRRILDCACGTGLQAIALAQAGYDVVGLDLSHEMLAGAREKAREHGLSLPLLQGDLREMGMLASERFDAVICMGNVLPHLMTERELRRALTQVNHALRLDGLFVIEMRYYDKLLDEQQRFILHQANIERDGQLITILYVIDHLPDRLRFNIVFVEAESGKEGAELETESIDYNPIRTGYLKALLAASGFAIDAFDIQGERMWIVCRKDRHISGG